MVDDVVDVAFPKGIYELLGPEKALQIVKTIQRGCQRKFVGMCAGTDAAFEHAIDEALGLSDQPLIVEE